MQFLKTLFWVVLAVVLVLFARENWRPVTIELWGGLQADVKIPILALAAFLIGWLPTFLVYRARVWGLKRRLEDQAHSHVANTPVASVRNLPAEPAAEDERRATDSKAWPAA